MTIPDQPAAGAYFYDPTIQQQFLTYQTGSAMKTVTWPVNSSALKEIPVHSFPKAVLPGGYLYCEANGEATVYDRNGALVGKKVIGAVHFAHVVADPSTGEPRLVFTYVFRAVRNGANVLYIRVYSQTEAEFLAGL